ncbi:glycosyltransferase [Amycolatopsis magusensis]|uniref:glycosyltransferase n=1 Tax=Amycolatopsis magusensis TaxID=882444 RepID=UPI0037A700EC
MKIALVPFGSRGDIQPFLALGTALRARGHDVDLITTGNFRSLAGEAGLTLQEVPGDTGNFFELPAVVESIRKSPSALRMTRKLPDVDAATYGEVLARIDDACAYADFTVNALFTKGINVARDDRNWCATSWWPVTPTRHFPAFGAPEVPLGTPYHRFSHLVSGQVEWLKTRAMVNDFRSRRGLGKLGLRSAYRDLGHRTPLLYPYSPALIPPPLDWPAEAHVTGYWFWERDWTPPPVLVEFMETEPKPLVATFGSTWAVHREDETRAALRTAARRAGRRIVVVGGRPEPLDDGDFHLREADYRWLFSRAAAVIHHGGYGTTAEVLRAGVPQVVVPTFADHPFWSRRVRALGVGSKPVPFQRLAPEPLAASVLEALGNPAIAAKAAQVGTRVQAERGTELACDLIERHLH